MVGEIVSSWEYPAPVSNCYSLAGRVTLQVRAKECPISDSGAAAVYDSIALDDVPWGYTRTVIDDPDSPGSFTTTDFEQIGTPESNAWAEFSAEVAEVSSYFARSCEYQFVFDPGHAWREMDGDGVILKWAKRESVAVFDEDLSEWVMTPVSDSSLTATLALELGDSMAFSEVYTLSTSTSHTRLQLIPGQIPTNFSVQAYQSPEGPEVWTSIGSVGVGYDGTCYIFNDSPGFPPFEDSMRHTLYAWRSWRRGADARRLKLVFSENPDYPAGSVSYHALVTTTVTIDSGTHTAEVIIEPPVAEGYIAASAFALASSATMPGAIPSVRSTQTC